MRQENRPVRRASETSESAGPGAEARCDTTHHRLESGQQTTGVTQEQRLETDQRLERTTGPRQEEEVGSIWPAHHRLEGRRTSGPRQDARHETMDHRSERTRFGQETGLAPGRRTAARRPALTTAQVLLAYYKDNDVFSPDGVLKLIALGICICVAALQLGGAGCSGGGLGGARGAAGAALAAAGALVLLLAARALQLHHAASSLYLLMDVTCCSVAGGLLLVSAALRLLACRPLTPADYMSAPLALCASGLLTASATITHAAAMRAYDAARAQLPMPPPRADSREHHV